MRLEHWLYTVPLRLRSLFRRRQVERELDEELQYHLERQTEEYLAKGLTPEEARYAALRSLGGLEQRKEECRDMRRVNLIDNSLQDLRYALRILRRSPGFTLVAILSLTFGIGANTAVFQLIDAIRLRSLPVAKPDELAEVRIAGGTQGFGLRGGSNTHITNPLWEQIREHQEAFAGIFAWGDALFAVGRGTDARRAKGLMVSGDFFPVLGVSPLRGRLFNANDDRRGCGLGGVVISHSFWQSHFGGQDSAIGQTLMISEKPFQVIGVTPPEFFGLEVGKGFDISLPLCANGNWDRALDRRDVWMLVVMGRLKPGWSLAQASSHLNAISPGMIEATLPPGYDASHLETYRRFRLMALPAGHGVSVLRENYETSLWLLLGMTGLVLLIACANLANLLLARASAREREISVRIALGASRGRLVRQMLCESLLLAGIGAALGVNLAQVLSHTLISFLTTEGDSLQLDLRLNWEVLVFTGSVAILTSVIFGLIPALRASHLDPGTVMKASGRGMTANRERFSLQRFLIVGQIAISLVLLIGAVLFVRSFRNLSNLDAGFRQQGILIATIDFGRLRLPPDRFIPYQAEVLRQIREIREVESAGTSTNIPLSGNSWTQGVQLPGRNSALNGASKFTYISPDYFKTMEIALLAGRDFNEFDTPSSRKVAVVNETFVRRFFADQNPIGALIRSIAEPGYPETVYEVIGIVKDTKYSDLRDEIPPGTFIPATQHPAPRPGLVMAIRSSAPLKDVMAQVRNRLGTMNPELRVYFSIFEEQISQRLIQERLMAWLAGFFGALAAALAMIGLYGVISYMVLKRRNELGIRLALGASRARIILLVLRETLLLLLVGLILGTIASVAVAKGAAALLFNLSPYDLPPLIISILSLALVAGLASYVPAWRASRVNPVVALRHD